MQLRISVAGFHRDVASVPRVLWRTRGASVVRQASQEALHIHADQRRSGTWRKRMDTRCVAVNGEAVDRRPAMTPTLDRLTRERLRAAMRDWPEVRKILGTNAILAHVHGAPHTDTSIDFNALFTVDLPAMLDQIEALEG